MNGSNMNDIVEDILYSCPYDPYFDCMDCNPGHCYNCQYSSEFYDDEEFGVICTFGSDF